MVLIDATQEKADAGKDNVSKLLDKQIERGKSSPEKKAEVLGHITATADYAGLKTADLVIEAVFEDRAVKAEVTKKAESSMKPGAIYASNTSTLRSPASPRPARARRSSSASISSRRWTAWAWSRSSWASRPSNRALATAVDYVAKIRKTPIVVNDSRGFYTSRCFGTYTREGMAMLAEGIHPAMIENVGRMAGMPMGSLKWWTASASTRR